jgi:hypothetical protein
MLCSRIKRTPMTLALPTLTHHITLVLDDSKQKISIPRQISPPQRKLCHKVPPTVVRCLKHGGTEEPISRLKSSLCECRRGSSTIDRDKLNAPVSMSADPNLPISRRFRMVTKDVSSFAACRLCRRCTRRLRGGEAGVQQARVGRPNCEGNVRGGGETRVRHPRNGYPSIAAFLRIG